MRNVAIDAIRRAAALVLTLLLVTGCSSLNHPTQGEASSSPQKNAPLVSSKQKLSKAWDRFHATGEYQDVWERMRTGFSLPNYRNARVVYYENWYSSRPDYLARIVERARWFLPDILDQLEQRRMPSDLALLPVIESAYRTDARSRSNAVGMWQFIAGTGKRFGLRQDWWYDGRSDPKQSTRAALDYLEILADEFNGDWFLALAGYNAGENRVHKERLRNRKRGHPTTYPYLHLRKETKDYVPKLLAVRNIVRDPRRFGVTLAPVANHAQLASVNARTQTDLAVMAKLTGISTKQMLFLNNGYKRGVTPPNGPHTVLIPVEKQVKLVAGLKKLGREERVRMVRYRVRRGDSLGSISRRYGTAVAAIKTTNKLAGNMIHPGQTLLIPAYKGEYRVAAVNKMPKKKVRSKGSRDKRWTTHRVKSGDTLWSISRRYGVELSQLTKWNKISRNRVLHRGDRLAVYR